MIRDLTQGSVTRLLLVFSYPLLLSNLLQTVYNMVDMIVIGQFVGKAGLSAVSIGGDLLHLLTFLAMGFANAGQVILSQYIGAGNRERVKGTIGTMFTLLGAAAVVLTVVCALLLDTFLGWMNTPAESLLYTRQYGMTCILGMIFIYGYNLVSAIMRGMGDSKRPFLFIAVAAILNMILDVLFVKYLHMEVFGAALATVIGQGVSFLASLVYLYRRRESFGFDFRPASFRIDGPTFRRLLALGIPMAIQSAAINLSKILLMSWINLFDVTYSALAGIFNKLNTMCGVISQSFTTAGSTMVGQNLGGRKYKRVNETLLTILLIGMGFAALFTAVMLLWPEGVYGMFTPDPDVLSVAAVLTLPVILNFFGAGTRSVAFSLINGSGRAKLNLAVAIIDGMISRIGLAALFGFALHWDCFGFWMGDALAGFMPLLIGGVFYLSGRWRSREGAEA